MSQHSKVPVHDVESDAAERRVCECFGNGPDDLKSELLPESYGGVVRFDDGVELHRGVPLRLCPGERVLAERAPDSAAPRIAGDHEASRGDVRARTGTIWSHLRRSEHPRSIAGDDRVTRRRLDPDLTGLVRRPCGVVRVGVTGGDDLPEDWPDGWPVTVDVFPNPHDVILFKVPSSGKVAPL